MDEATNGQREANTQASSDKVTAPALTLSLARAFMQRPGNGDMLTMMMQSLSAGKQDTHDMISPTNILLEESNQLLSVLFRIVAFPTVNIPFPDQQGQLVRDVITQRSLAVLYAVATGEAGQSASSNCAWIMLNARNAAYALNYVQGWMTMSATRNDAGAQKLFAAVSKYTAILAYQC